MVTCPQCHKANPENNRFCQFCGHALLLVCPYCGSHTHPLQRQCEACHGDLGHPLIALVLNGDQQQFQDRSALDKQNRYRFFDSPFVSKQDFPWFCVIDSCPEKNPHLAHVLQHAIAEQLTIAKRHKLPEENQGPHKEIPSITLKYLSLQGCSPLFPRLYDAWNQAENQQVLLFQHRAQPLTSLYAYCHFDTPLYEQPFYWCFQMLEVWPKLVSLNCCQTFLNSENLYLTEEDELVVRQLLDDNVTSTATFQDLASAWQRVFNLAETSRWPSLYKLTQKAIVGKIESFNTFKIEFSTLLPEEFSKLIEPPVVDTRSLGHDDGWQTERDTPGTAPLEAHSHDDVEDDSDTLNFALQDTDKAQQNSDARCLTLLEPSPASEQGGLAPQISSGARDGQRSITHQSGDEETVLQDQEVATSRDAEGLFSWRLSPKLIAINSAGKTDTGSVRQHNEDRYHMQTWTEENESHLGKQFQGRGLYIVCDGMGGHEAGEVASHKSVETLKAFFKLSWKAKFPDAELIRQGIFRANETVFSLNVGDARSGNGRMGTTLAMLLVQETQVAIAHVGDSRIYKVSRGQGIEQLTIDHEVGHQELAQGVPHDIAYSRPDAYLLTQAIGPRDNSFVEPDIIHSEINEDCLFLLCSDGLSDHGLIEKTWKRFLLPLIEPQADLDKGVRALIALGNKKNGHDNISAILVRLGVQMTSIDSGS